MQNINPMKGASPDMFRALVSEHKKIVQLWREVTRACGVSSIADRIKPRPAPPWIMDDKNMGAAVLSYGDGEEIKALGYGMGISLNMTDEQLRGIMAHELGHIVNGDLDGRQQSYYQEMAADEFAARHGFGPALSEALSICSIGYTDEESAADGIHPPVSQRIFALASLHSSYSKKAA